MLIRIKQIATCLSKGFGPNLCNFNIVKYYTPISHTIKHINFINYVYYTVHKYNKSNTYIVINKTIKINTKKLTTIIPTSYIPKYNLSPDYG